MLCRAFETDRITDIRRLFNDGRYLQCNYVAEEDNPTSQQLLKFMQRFRGQQFCAAEGIVFSELSLLLLIGKGGKSSTSFHVDWTQAKSLALALDPKARRHWLMQSSQCSICWSKLLGVSMPADALTEQCCILRHPSAFTRSLHAAGGLHQGPCSVGVCAAWLCRGACGLGAPAAAGHTGEGLILTLDQAMEMQAAVPGVIILRQCAGDLITVPAGWLHLVINLADACKLAYDYFEVDQFSSVC